MNALQKGTVALLKSALTGQAQTLPEDFDLEAAWPVLKRHNIDPLLYEGAVLCGVPRNTEFMQKLFQRVCQGLIINEGQLRELNRLYDAFEANGIQYMPLKGIKMKKRYPRPDLRPMGDADVLIRLDQYPAIVPILESLGYQSVLESDHELVWKTKSLYLELHKWVIPSYNEDYFAYFGDGWKLATKSKGCRWSMTHEAEFVYMFTHFAKHYRDGGIGCRHVTDLWVYRRTHPAMDEALVRQELEKLDLLRFYDNMRHVLAVWFDDAEGTEIVEHITEFVFSSGSWGEKENHFQSSLLRKETKYAKGMNAKVIYLWSMLFPDVKALQSCYPVLQKAPWLLPVVWCYRIVKQVFLRRALQRHGQQLKAATNESMEIRRQMLEQVGLRY